MNVKKNETNTSYIKLTYRIVTKRFLSNKILNFKYILNELFIDMLLLFKFKYS